MENINQNPLANHFRQAVIHTKLVSNGKFWPEGSINLPVTGEIPVLPMTLKDEIILKTPDALMNGSGVVDVIQSCCPSIANAWDMPSIDVDQIIIAIRIATYGEHMDIDATCPQSECKEENSYQINLHNIQAGITMPKYNVPVEVDGLQIFLKPQKYFDLNKRNKLEFEEEQMMKVIREANDSSDKEVVTAQFNQHLNNVLDLNYESLTTSTEKIITETGTVVSNPEFIKEFYTNVQGSVIKKVQDVVSTFARDIAVKPFDVTCPHCNHQYKVSFTFDYANFFA
jgi:hypothetical protein